MHPFIHPLSRGGGSGRGKPRSDWEIYKGIAKKFSEVAPRCLGVEKDVVLHADHARQPGEIAQALDVKDWKTRRARADPGKTMPAVTVVERDYPNLYKQLHRARSADDEARQRRQGHRLEHRARGRAARRAQRHVAEGGATKGWPRIETDIDAAEVILMLAPETNGEVAVKAWEALSKATGRDHAHLALPEGGREDPLPRRAGPAAQDHLLADLVRASRAEKVCYNAGYTNVHELIPWRTLTGRQQLYQDHLWMRAFGEGFCIYRPPVDLKTIAPVQGMQAQRQQGDRPQLHHAAPEMGHPLAPTPTTC
jgi:nitrate reductase alpha subunit